MTCKTASHFFCFCIDGFGVGASLSETKVGTKLFRVTDISFSNFGTFLMEDTHTQCKACATNVCSKTPLESESLQSFGATVQS